MTDFSHIEKQIEQLSEWTYASSNNGEKVTDEAATTMRQMLEAIRALLHQREFVIDYFDEEDGAGIFDRVDAALDKLEASDE